MTEEQAEGMANEIANLIKIQAEEVDATPKQMAAVLMTAAAYLGSCTEWGPEPE